MGVQGLWSLLQPCARPTKLEDLEGKRLAIDSSIWLYHFQMAMRDKEGRTLYNAHILGFVWRILKLIHHGIRPIFVFDGGAPALKRATLAGRSKRKKGARDDVRHVAERLLHARMREAALAHVSGGPSGSASKEQDVVPGEHGLGSETVYMDDLAGTTSASAAFERAADALDDGGLTSRRARDKGKEKEDQARKKRDKFQEKDPYALPALDRELHMLTAENSAAAQASRRGGGRRPDIRFATEGELRSLLSSIQPTDLDLDSEFFRSLPTELQYELVGDLRAASRGTSYKRLQAMLASSPTPIDFSRAQIAGLKTRNELTQKVLEVTDEIGDAHIKVPVRVAGARNREYVLIRNKGGQAGFMLGIRETGETQDKAIAVDDETATDATEDDELDKRSTDDDILLEDVDLAEASPQKAAMPHIPDDIMLANPNDPLARKKVAEELLQRRARELAREKAKELGIIDEHEIMEEEIKQMQALRPNGNGRKGSSNGTRQSRAALFRSDGYNLDRIGASGSDDEDYEADEDRSETERESQIDLDEQDDLARALTESAKESRAMHVEVSDDEDEEDIELDVVDTNGVDASDYSTFYGHATSSKDTASRPSGGSAKATIATRERPRTPPSRDTTPTRQDERVPGLGFRPSDLEGYPERRLKKVRREDEGSAISVGEKEQIVQKTAASIVSVTDSDLSDMDMSGPKPLSSRSKTTTKRKESLGGDHNGNVVKVVDFQDVAAQEQRALIAGTNSFPRLSSVKKATKEGREIRAAAPAGDRDKVPFEEQSVSSEEAVQTASEVVDTASQLSASKKERSVTSSSPDPVAEEAEPPVDVRQAETASESSKDHSTAPSSPPGIGVRRLESVPASPSIDLPDEPEFDNLVSMAEEEGSFSDIRVEDADVQPIQSPQHDDDGPVYSPDWSRSPTPADEVVLGPDGFPLPTAAELEAMDAEDERELGDITGYQNEFVSFLSKTKNRGLNEVRQEVEDEVNKLRSEHASTRRAEGDVTLQMAKEIQLMLRLFGLPYITAPMEAEAQCAELVTIGLADGIITDDSDVFLFGGTFVYKNMFNLNKFVECYKLSDLQHDLGMDRTKLVQLAYLLGSDYTDGLDGVGPVLAMEILSSFDGDDGLVKFREWWMKVQKGQDTPRDTCNTTLKRIKRTLRNKVHMAENDSWPDEKVLNAYYEPEVDSSDEAFQWGLPDLDSLRSFFQEYLSWDREKTDHYLIPSIEAQNRRGQRTQSRLDNGNFFDLTAGQSVNAAREKRGYKSTRLQNVVTNFRASKIAAAQKPTQSGGTEDEPLALAEDDDGIEKVVPEPLVGKEMAKRSRPIVTKSKKAVPARQENEELQAVASDGVDDPQTADKSKGRKKASKKDASREISTRRKAARKKTSNKKRSSGDAADEGDLVDDVEWRPCAAKPKKRKTGPQADAPNATRLAQARVMNLDHVDALPPSRAPSMRPGMSASTSRESLFRGRQNAVVISEDDSSDLSDA